MRHSILTLFYGLLIAGTLSTAPPISASAPLLTASVPDPLAGNPWIGLTTKDHKSAQDVDNLIKQVPLLAAEGMNVLVYEVDYSFDFQTHPELRYGYAVPKTQIRALAAECKRVGVRLIPLFNCFGHQSIEDDGPNLPMMDKHPEFDETPGQFPNNKGVYARCWCPLAPGLNRIVFDIFKELVDAFQCDAVHVGMDEIFHIGLDARCKGRSPASLLTQAVKTYHDFLRDSCGVKMLMWGDRLIPSTLIDHTWEASDVGTAPAVDSIPKDILICDWHYETSYTNIAKGDYPTIPYFTSRGFNVWPCGFQTVSANKAMIDYVTKNKSDKVLGYLASVWESTANSNLSAWQPITAAFSAYGATDATPPSNVILNQPAMAGTSVIRVTWMFPSDPESGIAGYEVYRDTVAGPTKLLKKIGFNVAELLDSNVVLNKKYYYRVKAVNRKGLLSAAFSNEGSLTAGDVSILQPISARPASLNGAVRVRWIGADGRKIEDGDANLIRLRRP